PPRRVLDRAQPSVTAQKRPQRGGPQSEAVAGRGSGIVNPRTIKASTVKYPEALDREQETAKFLQLDLPEMGASTSIFLQIRDRDSLESQAVILCWRKRCVEDLMRPRERRETGEQDMFRSRLDQVIDMDHALAKLARTIDWGFLEEKFGEVYKDGAGQPPLPTRLMAGLAILKHTYN